MMNMFPMYVKVVNYVILLYFTVSLDSLFSPRVQQARPMMGHSVTWYHCSCSTSVLSALFLR